ncbi:hypothetical protein SKAU_G00162890 [Synaphobranchus kaupii]|uniref:Uncharacterized protein n=1 Tax=Synaphobranchus kaupii TaxID=118154 RepID=A0A9Q1FIV2_SYNKA|nr:hypothetical protein SKAU_G00162890 [Synaphobranchus kaupii]
MNPRQRRRADLQSSGLEDEVLFQHVARGRLTGREMHTPSLFLLRPPPQPRLSVTGRDGQRVLSEINALVDSQGVGLRGWGRLLAEEEDSGEALCSAGPPRASPAAPRAEVFIPDKARAGISPCPRSREDAGQTQIRMPESILTLL